MQEASTGECLQMAVTASGERMLVAFVTVASARDAPDASSITVGGYVETFWSYNFGNPSNGVTNLRGFDNRHNSISLSNVALDASGSLGDLSARVVLQAGLTPDTYYLAEPVYPAVGGVGETDRFTWRNVQTAMGTWAISDKVSVDAGLYLSPIGPESISVKDDWNFSRSNLFFGLPFYHTGAHVNWTVSDSLQVMAHVCNGWNSVVDNNPAKTVGSQAIVTTGPVTASVQYMGGIERPTGAPEGQPWRHVGDVWLQLDASSRLSFLLHGDVGLEDNQVGTNTWAAGALYARVQPVDALYVALRGDWFGEKATDGAGAIFWPTVDEEGRVASGTLTLDLRPVDHLSLELEGRHDASKGPAFFDDSVETDAATGAPIPDRKTQDTVTVGLVAWF
jgi:hypothetical protein